MCIGKHYPTLRAAVCCGPQGTDSEVELCVYKLSEFRKQNWAEVKVGGWCGCTRSLSRPPRGHWSWDGLAELSQIEAKELNPHAPEVTSHFL